MADRNNNGVQDHLEKVNRPGVVKPQNPFMGAVTDVARQGYNFLDDITVFPSMFVPKNADPEYRAGDYLFGITQERADRSGKSALDRNALIPQRQQAQPAAPPVGNTRLPSFMDFLTQAMEQSGGMGSVSYDPLRQDAQRRSGEYDAKIAAMYDQLQNSMRADGTAMQQAYQGAIDDTAARSTETQGQIQSASNAADSRNMEVLRNLGIEAAQGNIISEGRDLNTQTADAVADAAARGQISGDRLTQNQQTAGELNTGLVGAAGLEGNEQRARIQSELASLMAQYDMQEQEANRQAQQQSFTQSMGLANAMYDDAWRQQGYQDDLSKWLYEQQLQQQAAPRTDPMQYSMNFIGQLMQRPEFADADLEQIIKLLGPAASIGKLAN